MIRGRGGVSRFFEKILPAKGGVEIFLKTRRARPLHPTAVATGSPLSYLSFFVFFSWPETSKRCFDRLRMTSGIFFEIDHLYTKKADGKRQGYEECLPFEKQRLTGGHQRGHERILLPSGDGAAYISLRCMGRRNERPKALASGWQRNTVYGA